MEQQKARIIAIKDNMLTCSIECADACQGCAAKKLCAGDNAQNQKTISLISYNKAHKEGDIITLEVSSAMGLRAVLLAYILPVVLIMILLVVMKELGVDDLKSGLIALGALALYFISLKVFSIGKSVSISVVEDN